LLPVDIPVIAGPSTEELLPGVVRIGNRGRLAIGQCDDWIVGGAVLPAESHLDALAMGLYEEIFRAAEGHHIARFWNYVPDINADSPEGLENYRLFCRGRAAAFARRFGENFTTALPAATGIGGPAGRLSVFFAACRTPPAYVENPLQTPAYKYPAAYGKAAPSFSRATVTQCAAGRIAFISGTAAIRGHDTIAPGDTLAQVDCMLENLAEIAKASGIGPRLGEGLARWRHFKVYVRDAADGPSVALRIERDLLKPGDTVSYLHANICRASLTVEIEAGVCIPG